MPRSSNVTNIDRGRAIDTVPPAPVTPHSIDAERSTLGGILINNDRFHDAAAIITAEHFFREAHRRIFTAMVDVRERGEAIDLVTLKEALTRSGDLEEVGGVSYLAELVDGVPRNSHVAHYAGIVKEKADLRAIIAGGTAAIEAAYAGDRARGGEHLSTAVAKLTGASTHDLQVARGLDQELLRREVRRLADAKERGPVPEVVVHPLKQWLTEPDIEEPSRFDDWMAKGTRVLLSAQYKAGKTTLVNNVIRSLVDGDPWLGRYGVSAIEGSVALLDFEMSEAQLKRWLREHQIEHAELVNIFPMRGKGAAFNILDATGRAKWAERLRQANTTFLIVDCVKPILDAFGLDEHKEVGRLLSAIDALLVEAGIPECVLVQHMGHTGERARGDSTLLGWPDAIWTLVRQNDDPGALRFIKAYGRDIDIPESQLAYDNSTRRLTIAGGSRRDAGTYRALDAVLGAVGAGEPLSGLAIKKALAEDGDHGRNAIEEALKLGVRTGKLAVRPGPHGSKLYQPAASRPTNSESGQ